MARDDVLLSVNEEGMGVQVIKLGLGEQAPGGRMYATGDPAVFLNVMKGPNSLGGTRRSPCGRVDNRPTRSGG